MAERIPQSIAKRVVFRAYLASDGKTLATGKTIAITISKNGGAFANPAAGATNATEISSGFYYFDLGTGDTGTTGPLAWRGAEGTINDAGDAYEVVNANNAGLAALPNTACTTNASLITSGTGTDQLQVTSGLASSDAKKVNAVSTSSVTTINANIGTTQPTNFTGTGASALVKSDMIDIAGAAVATGTAQLGVNVVSYASGQAPLQPTVAGRTLDVTATGEAGIDWGNIGNPTTVVSLSGTTVATVTTATTTTNLTNAPTSGDFTATMKASIGTAVAASAVASVTGNVGGNILGNVIGSVGSIAGITFPANFSALVITSAGIVAVTSNVKKNQALAGFTFLMTDSTNHAPTAGLTLTVTRKIDSGSFAAGTLANVTDLGGGLYSVDFGAGDLNGNVVTLKVTATGADTTIERIITQP